MTSQRVPEGVDRDTLEDRSGYAGDRKSDKEDIQVLDDAAKLDNWENAILERKAVFVSSMTYVDDVSGSFQRNSYIEYLMVVIARLYRNSKA